MPATIHAVSGDNQLGFVNRSLLNPLVIELQDEHGNPIQNATIDLTIDQGIPITDHTIINSQAMPSAREVRYLLSTGCEIIWIVTEDQVANQNRATVTFQAVRTGLLDQVGNNLPTNATASNTIRLAAGTVVHIQSHTVFQIIDTYDMFLEFGTIDGNYYSLAEAIRRNIVTGFDKIRFTNNRRQWIEYQCLIELGDNEGTYYNLENISGLETLPTFDRIRFSYDNMNWAEFQLPELVTQAEAEAGVLTDIKSWSPERVKQAIEALSLNYTGLKRILRGSTSVRITPDDEAETLTFSAATPDITLQCLTQAEFDALPTKDPTVLYLIP